MTTVELNENSTKNIARRYGYLFRLPSTGFALIYASIPLIAIELIARSASGNTALRVALYALASEAALILAIGIDLFAVRSRRPGLASFRRLATASILSNIAWFAVSLVGLAMFAVNKNEGRLFSLVLLGAFFAICVRAVILGSVFFTEPLRALPLAILQPAILFVPVAFSTTVISAYPLNALYGVLGGVVAIVGTEVYLGLINKPVMGFRALPLLQAFLSAWTAGNASDLEGYFQESSEERRVTTEIVRIQSIGNREPSAALILPGIHPGPFSPVGSSNLPGDIYSKLRTESTIPLIFHSISDHDLNLPSKEEVRKYAQSLESSASIDSGNTISSRIVIREGKATASGFALGKTLLIALTLAPYGMEDLPETVREKIEAESARMGFEACLVIDSHNSLGEKPDDVETGNLVRAAARIVEQLSQETQKRFDFGFAHTSELSEKFSPDIGPAGVGLLFFQTASSRFCLAVVDANNSTLGFREQVIQNFQRAASETLLEICTSDTHVTAAKAHNAKGYLALGDVTTPNQFSALLQQLLEKAKSRTSTGSYETSVIDSSVRTIGGQVLNSFSGLLDETSSIAKKGAQALGVLGIVITLAIAFL